MTRLRRALWLLCLPCLLPFASGCGFNDPALVTISGSERIGDTAAHYAASREGVFFVLWHDFNPRERTASSYTSTGSSSSAKSTEIEGEFSSEDGKALSWTCHTVDGLAGTVVIAGEKYELAEGGVFLVKDTAAGPEVAQLDLDLGEPKLIGATLKSLARTEPLVREFVSR